MRRTRKRHTTIRKKGPTNKQIMRHYHNEDTVEITYNNRILVGIITFVNPIGETITVEKKDGKFYINLEQITKVVKVE